MLGPDGHIYGVPSRARRVFRIRVDTGDVTEIGPDLGDRERKYLCAVLGLAGHI